MQIGMECGTKWWRFRDWKRHSNRRTLLRWMYEWDVARLVPVRLDKKIGFAIGPVMIVWRKF